MATTLNEGERTGGFLVSEARGTRSRETETVASGQNLKAGQVVQKDGSGKLVAKDGNLNTDGTVVTEAAGVLLDNVDASATGADADVAGVVMIARDAEVNESELTYPTESSSGGEKAGTNVSLAKLGIIAR